MAENERNRLNEEQEDADGCCNVSKWIIRRGFSQTGRNEQLLWTYM